VGDCAAHVVDMGGSGPPLVLIHGILVSSWAWRLNLETLAKHFRVIAICQKGHGWSDAPRHGSPSGDYSFEGLADFVLRVMGVLGLERVHLCGNSLGGAVCLRIALDHPDRVDRLVLVDSAGVPFRYVRALTRWQSALLAPAYRLVGRATVFKVLLKTTAYRRLAIDEHYMRAFMGPLRRRGRLAAAGAALGQLHDGSRRIFSRLPNLKHPTLIIWGRHDLLVPLRAGRLLEAAIPNTRFELFDDCAHCPMEEAPARFNRLVLDFLTQGG
jgi:pimeloyl-ACP methyl ester carboxylesterase